MIKLKFVLFKRSKNYKHLARLPGRRERRIKLLELETKEKTFLLTLQKFKKELQRTTANNCTLTN